MVTRVVFGPQRLHDLDKFIAERAPRFVENAEHLVLFGKASHTESWNNSPTTHQVKRGQRLGRDHRM